MSRALGEPHTEPVRFTQIFEVSCGGGSVMLVLMANAWLV